MQKKCSQALPYSACLQRKTMEKHHNGMQKQNAICVNGPLALQYSEIKYSWFNIVIKTSRTKPQWIHSGVMKTATKNTCEQLRVKSENRELSSRNYSNSN